MKKNLSRRGRPPKTQHTLPRWAVYQIAQIAKDAGASEAKVLELALRAGLIEIVELYKPIIEYARNLANHSSEVYNEELTASFVGSDSSPTEPDERVLEEYPRAPARLGGPASESGDQPEPLNADERSGLGETDGADLIYADPAPDRFTPAGRTMSLQEE